MKELAPREENDPCVVLLTPGVYNAAFYEHIYLAQEIGATLVEGRDLLVDGGNVYMRTTSGLQRVDVIYRRVDDKSVYAYVPDMIRYYLAEEPLLQNVKT